MSVNALLSGTVSPLVLSLFYDQRGGSTSDYLGLDGEFDYWIDAAAGSDLNAGTSEGAAWASLSKIADVSLLAGQTTRVRVKAGTYDTADDYVEVIENTATGATLEIVYEPGCIMDGTAANGVAPTNGHEFSGNVDWATVVYCNGLQVNNYHEATTTYSPNGFGNRDTHHLIVHDAYCDNCDDGFSCHENATMILHNCSAVNSEKGAFSHVDNATVEHHTSYFESDSATAPLGHSGGGGSLLLEDCVIVSPAGTGRLSLRSTDTAERCQIGTLTAKVTLNGSSGTLIDCFLHAYVDGHYPHTYRRCYGRFTSRTRTPGGLDMQDSVILGPAAGSTAVIVSTYNSGGDVAMTFSHNVVATSSFMSIDATNAGQLLSGGATFDGNSLWAGAVYDADLSASLISGTITTDPEIGSADSLLMADYASAVYATTLAGFGSGQAVERPDRVPRVLPHQLPVLSNFVDGLDGDPPTVIFDSDQAGTLTWDFHSSAPPPAIGAGDIGTGTDAVIAGENTIEIDLEAYADETGYLHMRVTSSYGVSNILTSGQFTVPDLELITNGTFDADISGWTNYIGPESLSWQATGRLRATTQAGQSNARGIQAITTEIGETYSVEGDVYPNSGFAQLKAGTTSGSNNLMSVNVMTQTIPATGSFVATGTTTYISLQNNIATEGSYSEFDNVSVRKTS